LILDRRGKGVIVIIADCDFVFHKREGMDVDRFAFFLDSDIIAKVCRMASEQRSHCRNEHAGCSEIRSHI